MADTTCRSGMKSVCGGVGRISCVASSRWVNWTLVQLRSHAYLTAFHLVVNMYRQCKLSFPPRFAVWSAAEDPFATSTCR
jgi:hypothetical protein